MSHPRSHLLVIGYVWPEPRSSAAGGHMMQILQAFLDQGWQITFASPAGDGEHMADLAALGIARQPIALNNESFDRFVATLAPDVVLFDRFLMEEQFGWRVEKHCPQALRVLETCDLQSLRDARQALLKQRLKDNPEGEDFSDLFQLDHPGLYRHMAAADISQREMAAIYRSDLSLMISDAESTLLTEHFRVPAALLHACPLMVDDTPRDWKPFEQRAHFLSIGNFRHAPNWDAVLWLKTVLWPRIRQRLPQAELHLYGAYTPPKATALNNPTQGFRIMNWAEDALQVMGDARVALAPLRFGAGIKGKLLDAMLCGTPSVTTAIGAEGMRGDLPWPGRVENDVAGLVEAAVTLYQQADTWQHAQAQAMPLLRQRYAYTAHAQALVQRVESVRQTLAEHRLANFTGAMLRHHHHKSTQYMAQWIEAKGKISS
ncbi:glycosyltransferase [Pseudomonas sp.]|uniref:glycosyltransferase n=1 Tax=Pseudomonas sp. TaxID=306 RepID=UPI003CC55AFD